jgi:hypothetical protein
LIFFRCIGAGVLRATPQRKHHARHNESWKQQAKEYAWIQQLLNLADLLAPLV